MAADIVNRQKKMFVSVDTTLIPMMTPKNGLTFALAPFVQTQCSRTMSGSTVIAAAGLTPTIST